MSDQYCVVDPWCKYLPLHRLAVTPMFSQVRANLRESETLAALRDTLLPRLLSGECRVANVEPNLETAL